MKLKKWVKVSLGVLVTIGLVVFIHNYTNQEISNCVKAGNDKNYCEKGLL